MTSLLPVPQPARDEGALEIIRGTSTHFAKTHKGSERKSNLARVSQTRPVLELDFGNSRFLLCRPSYPPNPPPTPPHAKGAEGTFWKPLMRAETLLSQDVVQALKLHILGEKHQQRGRMPKGAYTSGSGAHQTSQLLGPRAAMLDNLPKVTCAGGWRAGCGSAGLRSLSHTILSLGLVDWNRRDPK